MDSHAKHATSNQIEVPGGSLWMKDERICESRIWAEFRRGRVRLGRKRREGGGPFSLVGSVMTRRLKDPKVRPLLCGAYKIAIDFEDITISCSLLNENIDYTVM